MSETEIDEARQEKEGRGRRQAGLFIVVTVREFPSGQRVTSRAGRQNLEPEEAAASSKKLHGGEAPSIWGNLGVERSFFARPSRFWICSDRGGGGERLADEDEHRYLQYLEFVCASPCNYWYS